MVAEAPNRSGPDGVCRSPLPTWLSDETIGPMEFWTVTYGRSTDDIKFHPVKVTGVVWGKGCFARGVETDVED